MVRLNKIYTRTGDDGTTGLADGSRRAKNDPRIAAYGTVDEANCAIGLARLHSSGDDDARLARIQNDLFDLGADLSTPGGVTGALRITGEQIKRLETEIDAMNAALQPLTSFVLPGGSALAAHLHLARTIVRRAERIAAGTAAEAGSDRTGSEDLGALPLQYLNRLSDHLFVMSRRANTNGADDVLWVPGENRSRPQ